MSDPISRAELRRAELLEQLGEAAEQFEAWQDERNRLVIEVIAAGGSYRDAAGPARLSPSGIGKIVHRESDPPDVE